MKILFCALGIYSSVGGMQQFDRRVVRCLSELQSGHRLRASVMVLWDGHENSNKCPSNVQFIPCSHRKVYMLLRFAWMLLRQRPAIILYDHVLLVPLALIAGFLSPRARQVLFIHGTEVWESAGPVRRRIVSGFIQSIVSVSCFTAARMQQNYGLSQSRFALLPNAIDLGGNEGGRCLDQFKVLGKHRLLTVSRLAERYKGHERVIASMKKVLRAFPDTHYYVVGDGPLMGELRTRAHLAGVDSKVHFLGCLDDESLVTLYEQCHLFVMPSKGEGFGIVFLEAWKHKLPVIAGNRDASIEVIQHGINGLLVDPDSFEEIGGAILSLLGDEDRRRRLGQSGYRTLNEKYTHQHFRDRLAEVLCPQPGAATERNHENPTRS
jgi:phosphatidyl-myo-inositol dimannoside synthase